MSERKNHLTIDGGQVKDDEHVATYKPIPDADSEFRTSKSSLTKSKEKVSPDGAEEKLLKKEDEAKIVTRVDMADAMYVVGDHRNGDANIELDANKKGFQGMTKEELMRYAEDPFWVRLRWFMFILFWTVWLCMLGAAIAIIQGTPSCPRPSPRTWYEKGPLVEMSSVDDYAELESELATMNSVNVAGVFTFSCPNTYDVLDSPTPGCLEQFKEFVAKAKASSIKVIVDLTANFVSKSHKWFALSENRSAGYEDYFVWRSSNEFDEERQASDTQNKPIPKLPNNWVSTLNAPAWNWSEARQQFYLHHFGEDQPDLNFRNPDVVRQFDEVLKVWMSAGADGVRLNNVRQLLVNPSFQNETQASGKDVNLEADHTQYGFWSHDQTTDQPDLDSLLAHWSHIVATSLAESMFTIAEKADTVELFLKGGHNTSSLRPPLAAPFVVSDSNTTADYLNKRLSRWPAVQLMSADGDAADLAAFALLLPAAPIFDIKQLRESANSTSKESLSHLVALRGDASIEHGHHVVTAVRATQQDLYLLACARWKAAHTGYGAVYNPHAEELHARLSSLRSLPDALSVHYMSHAAHLYFNNTGTTHLDAEDVLVPPKSTIVFSYVPKTAVEN